jgi:hypothetical protein
MSPGTLVTLIGLLVAVFLGVTSALLWQEAKKRVSNEGPVYVMDHAVEFVLARLGDQALNRGEVKRILEYEIFYLQGLAQPNRRTPVEVVAGGTDPAVDYITAEIARRHNVSYPRDDIKRVLAIEAEYLLSIGAVGDPVSEQDLPGGDDE